MAVSLGIIASSISGHLWEPQGAYDALATITLSGTTASVNFASIPQGYKHLQLRALFRTTRATYNIDDIDLAFNDVTSGGKYAVHHTEGNIQNNGTVNPYSTASANKMFYIATGTTTVATNTFGVAIIDILDYANTSKNKTVRSLSGADANGGASGYFPTVRLASGLWMDTAAVNKITLNSSYGSSSFASGTQFTLYGVR